MLIYNYDKYDMMSSTMSTITQLENLAVYCRASEGGVG